MRLVHVVVRVKWASGSNTEDLWACKLFIVLTGGKGCKRRVTLFNTSIFYSVKQVPLSSKPVTTLKSTQVVPLMQFIALFTKLPGIAAHKGDVVSLH